MKLSQRLHDVPASPIRKLVPFAQKAKAEGVTVYHLNIGDPDIKTPDQMISVLKNWSVNPIGYDMSQGNPKFLQSLESYYQGLGFPFVKTAQIQVTTGGSEAISMAMFAVCEPGDELLVFEPFYANYNSYAVINGIRLVPISTSIGNGFHLPEREVIEAKISGKTKGILICNPNNPTGTVYTTEELDLLVALAQEYNLYVLSDEVYREYVYEGKSHVSILSYMEQIPEQAVLLDSMSKRYSLCGARLGVLVSLNQEIMSGVLRIAQGRLSSGLIDQIMAARLVDVPHSYIETVRKDYEARRQVLFDGLSVVPGVTIPKPEGAFYSIVGLPVDSAEKYAEWLLTTFRHENETVMVAPAAGFYATPGKGEQEVRIAYVLNTLKMQRAVELIRKSLADYPGKIS